MTTFGKDDDLRGAEFVGADLRGARFVESDLSGVVMRGVDLPHADIDAPWLVHGDRFLVNGVDVVAFVEGELDRRFPGRDQRRAEDPDGLRSAWTVLQQAWAAAVARVEDMPPGTVDESVAGEWSFAQTLRHLVMATDVWLRRAVFEVEQPFHPLGVPNGPDPEADGIDMSVFTTTPPTYDEVLEARADRVGLVTDFLASVTEEDLAVPRKNPWSPSHPETTLSCLHTILEEEWEHLRVATRDLDAIVAARAG
jgi:hypothetical protein